MFTIYAFKITIYKIYLNFAILKNFLLCFNRLHFITYKYW